VENEAVIIAAALCRRFEGLFLRPYLCPAGVPTIGYGTTRYPNGIRVSLLDPPITPELATTFLMWELQKQCIPAVEKYCPGVGVKTAAALIDFVYNLGAGRLQSSTLRKRVNEEDWDAATSELTKWVRGGGKILPGLVKRRAAEALLLGVE
jgi:lysozyme